ncbi:MAG: hypothetical protein LBE13_17970 [Bacteroidales bacterium]|jgi:hypothetical protein|nr:hypothetical protein [Bacteroidales bacterium]
MKRNLIRACVLAIPVIAVLVLVFNSCLKQAEEAGSDTNGVKRRKVAPHCFSPAQPVQVTLPISGICINVCIDCTAFQNGAIETCYNLCRSQYYDGNNNCQPFPDGTCCPYPLIIRYGGPKPATMENLRNPNYWRWMGFPSAVIPEGITTTDLLQIVEDPAFDFCFQ